jgi:hypothetical protein
MTPLWVTFFRPALREARPLARPRGRAIARSRGRASVGRAARTRAIGAIEARDRRRSSIASPDRASDGGDDDGGDG